MLQPLLRELDRQPIEQLGMRGQLAAHAEILRRGHEAATEQFLPQAIHRHARGERMIRRDQPFGERQAIGLVVRGHCRQCGRRAGRHLLAAAAKVAANVNVRRSTIGSFASTVGARVTVGSSAFSAVSLVCSSLALISASFAL